MNSRMVEIPFIVSLPRTGRNKITRKSRISNRTNQHRYVGGLTRIGIVVLFIHDVSDIPIDCLKLANYLKLENAPGFFIVEMSYASCNDLMVVRSIRSCHSLSTALPLSDSILLTRNKTTRKSRISKPSNTDARTQVHASLSISILRDLVGCVQEQAAACRIKKQRQVHSHFVITTRQIFCKRASWGENYDDNYGFYPFLQGYCSQYSTSVVLLCFRCWPFFSSLYFVCLLVQTCGNWSQAFDHEST